jgi:hypothetical protein
MYRRIRRPAKPTFLLWIAGPQAKKYSTIRIATCLESAQVGYRHASVPEINMPSPLGLRQTTITDSTKIVLPNQTRAVHDRGRGSGLPLVTCFFSVTKSTRITRLIRDWKQCRSGNKNVRRCRSARCRPATIQNSWVFFAKRKCVSVGCGCEKPAKIVKRGHLASHWWKM